MYLFTLYLTVKHLKWVPLHSFTGGVIRFITTEWLRARQVLFAGEQTPTTYCFQVKPETCEQEIRQTREVQSGYQREQLLGPKLRKEHSEYAEAAEHSFFANVRLLPYVWHLALNMGVTLLFGNLEINNRIASGCPLLYMGLAHMEVVQATGSLKQRRVGYLFKLSFIVLSIANLNLVPTNRAFL